MSEYRKADSREAEIIDRLNRRGTGWQKYDAASESQAAWKNQMMRVQEDIGLLCAEICEDYIIGESWIQLQDKLKQYDPAQERYDRSGTIMLGEYVRMFIRSKWLRKKVKEEDEKDPGERRAEDRDRKQNERAGAKGEIKTNENRMPKRVSLDAIMGWGEDRNGTKNEVRLKDIVKSAEDEAMLNLEGAESAELLENLVITMMAMSLNFSDYRKRLKKKEKEEQKLYIKMCYTERLVWLEMRDFVRLSHMDAIIQKDILKAMLKPYYWYWADGKMHYDPERREQPQIESLVTQAVRELNWMKTKDGGHKGWLEAKIPKGYWEKDRGKKLADSSLSEARKGYEQELRKLNEMAYGRNRQPQKQ